MPLLDQGAAALDAFIIAFMVLSFVVLGVICWIFWKAKKRDDAEEAARRRPPPGG
jgi:cbb3-type cytochrome oxidase subunit 3